APRLKEVSGIENRAFEIELARNHAAAERDRLQTQLIEVELARDHAAAERHRLQAQLVERDQTLEDLSTTIKALSAKAAASETRLQRITNSLGWRLLSRYGPIKYRFVSPAYKSIGKVFRFGPPGKNNQSSAVRTVDKN